MSKAFTLAELVVSLALGSLLLLAGLSGFRLLQGSYGHNRATWSSLQTIRLGEIMLDRDLRNLGYLLPRDLPARCWARHLLLAGVPVTSRHPGLSLGLQTPPYYAVVRSVNGRRLELDTLDLDGDGRIDFVAGQGLIGDSGAGLIERVETGAAVLWLAEVSNGSLVPDDRVVPAVHYEQRGTALWRDGQLALDGLAAFGAELEGGSLQVSLTAGTGASRRSICYARPLP
ncbi:MAG: hypothetical protein BWY87_00169 [Deltaproteobacteria bacterium ADurb.Bin510]|nr:MAG: hypothetical protein BWY87_00169 [Deltaproteobacteria bacterium ADurb.Bin510]